MKKILFITEAMGGGVFTYMVGLANALADTFDIYIAYAVRIQTPDDYRRYFDKRIHLIEVRNFGRSIHLLKDMKAFFEIRRIADRIRPDAIHLHSSKAGAIGRIAFDGKDVPLFYTPHGYSFLMENHSAVKRLLYRAAEAVCSKRNCTTISCSESEHRETRKLTGRAVYVNNGINLCELDTFMRDAEQISHPFTVFTLGRICYQKGPELFNRIALAMPEVRFLWIGDGELRKELTAPNIEITGWTDRKTALQYAVNAEVFVLTSRWEGLPVSLLEAMYMKKTCVVSDVIGNHDVIHSGRNGFVCTAEEEFIAAIVQCQKHLGVEYAETAHRDVLEHYNTEVMARGYSAIYRGRD